MNWRAEKPIVATRDYKPLSTENDLLTACSVILKFGRFIPLKYWDDWILRDTDQAILRFKDPKSAGEFMLASMKSGGRGILRAIWKNITGETKRWDTR